MEVVYDSICYHSLREILIHVLVLLEASTDSYRLLTLWHDAQKPAF